MSSLNKLFCVWRGGKGHRWLEVGLCAALAVMLPSGAIRAQMASESAMNDWLSATGKVETTYWLLSGTIEHDTVSLRPIYRLNTHVPLAQERSNDRYRLRWTSRTGKSFVHRFSPVAVAGGDVAVRRFSLILPDTGPISQLRIDGPAGPLSIISAQGSQGAKWRPGKVKAAPVLSVREQNSVLHIEWNHKDYPWIQIVFVDGKSGDRQLLQLDGKGGKLAIPAYDLPTMGYWEFALSDGANGELIRLQRQASL